MRDTLYAAPSRPPLAFRDVVTSLQRNDVSLEPVARVVYDAPQSGRVAADDLLAPGASWLTLDYRTIDVADHGGEASWELDRAATVSGIAVWFDSDLGGGFGFSTAPANETCPYGQLFLPFRHAVDVAAGDSLRIRIDLHLADDDYVWVWRAWTRSRIRQPRWRSSSCRSTFDCCEPSICLRAARPRRRLPCTLDAERGCWQAFELRGGRNCRRCALPVQLDDARKPGAVNAPSG